MAIPNRIRSSHSASKPLIATGEAVVGELTGERLSLLGSQILPWRVLRSAHPDARVLARPTDRPRPYGENPFWFALAAFYPNAKIRR